MQRKKLLETHHKPIKGFCTLVPYCRQLVPFLFIRQP